MLGVSWVCVGCVCFLGVCVYCVLRVVCYGLCALNENCVQINFNTKSILITMTWCYLWKKRTYEEKKDALQCNKIHCNVSSHTCDQFNPLCGLNDINSLALSDEWADKFVWLAFLMDVIAIILYILHIYLWFNWHCCNTWNFRMWNLTIRDAPNQKVHANLVCTFCVFVVFLFSFIK